MKYLILFLTFAKIGMFTIGGGYAMIPLIEREIVNKKWMTKNDFMEMFALTQSLPGVFAVNISIFVSYHTSLLCHYDADSNVLCTLSGQSNNDTHIQRNSSGSSGFNRIPLHFCCTCLEAEILAVGASRHRYITYMAMRTVTCLHRLGRNCRRAHLHIMVKR